MYDLHMINAMIMYKNDLFLYIEMITFMYMNMYVPNV